jgi:hypothetical protein
MTNDRSSLDEKLDRTLASEQELVPSSGFLATVMERVSEEAAAPPPIPFPWKRAVPGMALVAGVFGWGAIEFLRHGVPAAGHAILAAPQIPAAAVQPIESLGWVALALAASWLSWLGARGMAGRSGLM